MGFDAWLSGLDERHLADLTPSEVARALRALSSCYVERRAKLTAGGALDSAGKRAAFALFYAPLHFVVVREIVRALPGASDGLTRILDLGCGTGSAGAAWALESGAGVSGLDRNPWAVREANWTYRQLGIRGRAAQHDIAGARIEGGRAAGVLAAYSLNEVPEDVRAGLLPRLLAAQRQGARVLVVEPIARRLANWWPSWERTALEAGGRSDEWRFPAGLPPRQRDLAKAAGLDPRELKARSLFLPCRNTDVLAE